MSRCALLDHLPLIDGQGTIAVLDTSLSDSVPIDAGSSGANTNAADRQSVVLAK